MIQSKPITGGTAVDGLYMTNNSDKANNYENRDFITFSNSVGSATQEVNISYAVYNTRDKQQANTYYSINYFNSDGNFIFGIREASGGWTFSADIITANENGDPTTTALGSSHMSKLSGSTVNIKVKFSGNTAIVELDGNSYTAYTSIEGIKAVRLSVTGDNGYDRDMVVENFIVKTTEVEAAKLADYTLKYECDGQPIIGKDDVTKSSEVGSGISLNSTETADFKIGDTKYIFVSDDATGKTVAENGSTVVTLTYREANVYNYTITNNVNTNIKSGTCVEGEEIVVPYNRYILKNGILYSTGTKNNEYRIKEHLNDDYETSLNYTPTNITDGIYFVEAEDIPGIAISTRSDYSVDARCSNGAAGVADSPLEVCTLKPGKYKVLLGLYGNATQEFKVTAGDVNVFTTSTSGGLAEKTSEEFTLNEETTIYIQGGYSNKPLDYILITGVEMEPEDPWVASYPKTWTFTDWSETTVANLKDGSNWSDIEKADATDPTDATKDNCFWQVKKSEDISPNKYVKANGKSIEELKGLVYTNETNDRSLAIAVNYPETSIGTYHGSSYLWLGGSEINYFKIPNVPAGATIKMGVESHKNSEARGVVLSIGETVLSAPDGSEVKAPTTYVDQEWLVPVTAAESNDVQIKNTNGCHIYYITVTPGAEVSEIAINDQDGNDIETLELKIGAAYQLTATISPDNAVNKTVTWASSNEEIATVDQTGKVTTLAKGEVDITATSSNKISTTCKVTVVDAEIVVEEINLDKANATLSTGEKLQLVATVNPAEASVTWTSANEEVATVDENGNVTAVAAGEVVITATAGDKTAECTITVIVPVDGIALNFEKITVETGDEFVVGYTISPENATHKTVTWSSDNEEVATVDENGKVKAIAAGEATITAAAGEKTASCTVNVVSPEATDGVRVRMTYVDGTNCVLQNQTELTNRTDKVFGQIVAGESAIAGYNNIGGNSVGFGQPIWGANYITYLQVDASAIKDKYITSATLSFEASGATDSKRVTTWGVGYNNSTWSSAMSYSSADKNITTLGDTQSTSTSSAGTFETLSFDITDAINNAEGRIVTILVYETAAAGGYIKNPVVQIESTNESVYNVTFAEANNAEGVKVTVDGQDATNGTKLKNGTYTFTATAPHYLDYTGEFTVSDEDKNVEFEMTQKALWKYTVKNNVDNGIIDEGTTYEGESASVYFSKYIIAEDGTVWSKTVANNKEHVISFTPDKDEYVYTLEYSETTMKDGIFFKEAEDEYYTQDETLVATSTTGNRGSNKLGGYTNNPSAKLYTLLPGSYNIEIGAIGPAGNGAILHLKAGEQEIITSTALYSTLGVYKSSSTLTVTKATDLTIEGTDGNNVLDYILITGTVASVSLDKETAELELNEINNTVNLKASCLPEALSNAELVWSSSDDAVAKVDTTGRVIAVAEGTATITVALATETTVKAECVVTVKTVPVDSVVIKLDGKALPENNTIGMEKDGVYQLSAVVNPENSTERTVTWSSSNVNVATVDEATGVVTAKGVYGASTITATCGGVVGTCVVVYCKPGDSNGDGKVEIDEAILVSNFLVGEEKEPENWNTETNGNWKEYYVKAADVNDDGHVSVSDASATINLVLTDKPEASEEGVNRIAAYNDAADKLVVGGLKAANGASSVAVTLGNTTDYVALQADIFVPEGVNFEVKAGSRIAGSHSFAYHRFDANHMRIAIYNFDGKAFADNDEALFEIVADSNLVDAGEITLTNVLASDAAANPYVLGSRYEDTTGVSAFGFDGNAPVKVYDLNGRQVSDKVEGLAKGIYIIRQGDNVKKVNKR